ncbi:hypothetical protein G6F57_021471 [Rhizopus arrhizus]|nr:hypothetical protein G6F57_021471 [Rhizopus arrhizus]
MKSRSDTTSSAVCTGRPATRSAAALAASRTCSSVPSRMMSDSAASAASRMRRARSPLGQSGSASPPACGSPAACRFTSRRCRGSTARLPVKDPPSVL